MADGGHGLDAQWDDDVHHALHSLLTGETQGYYVDFGPLGVLAKTFTHAFLHDGTYSTFRERDHGAPIDPDRQRGWQFVVCLQNHDQVGNRAVGDRLPEITSPARLRVGAVLLLTSPFTPMLWMGEEWAASHPVAVLHLAPRAGAGRGHRRGPGRGVRRPRLGRLADDRPAGPGRLPHRDPGLVRAARPATTPAMLELYRALIGAARGRARPARPATCATSQVDFDEDERWLVVHRGAFRVCVNLGPAARRFPFPATEIVLATNPAALDDGAVVVGPDTAAVVRL